MNYLTLIRSLRELILYFRVRLSSWLHPDKGWLILVNGKYEKFVYSEHMSEEKGRGLGHPHDGGHR